MSVRVFAANLTCRILFAGLALSCGVTQRESSVDTQMLHQSLEVAGFVIGTDKPVMEQYSAGHYPSVAAGSNQRLAVYDDSGRIRGVRFDDTGVLELEWLDFGAQDRIQLYPAVAFGMDRFLVVWSESEDQGSSIYSQIVTLDGQLRGERSRLAEGFAAQVAWLGDAFVMSWIEDGVHLAKVDLDGALVANSSVRVTEVSAGVTRAVIATSGTQGVVAFSEDDGTRTNVRIARFDAQGAVLDPGGVIANPELQGTSEYSLATNDQNSLLTFKDDSDVIRGSILLADGSLTSTEFEVVGEGDVHGHTVGSDGANFVVVWELGGEETHDLQAKSVSSDGTVDTVSSNVGNASRAFQAWNLDLAFADDAYFLVYEGEGIFGNHFSPGLTNEPSMVALSALPNAQNIPVSAWNGSDYVVSWNDERGDSNQSRAVRVSKDGQVLDPEGIAVSPNGKRALASTSATNTQGTTTFVYTTLDDKRAYLRTMTKDGELTAPLMLADGNPRGDIVSNGTTFLLGLQVADPTSNLATLSVLPLNENGVPQGEARVVVTDFPRPRMMMVAQGQDFLLVYSGQTVETGAPIDGKMVRYSASGEKLGELESPSAGNAYYAMSANPDGAVVFGWNDYATKQLWFRMLMGDTWADASLLTAQPSEEVPTFAWNGDHFVSVWVESRKALWTRDVALDGSLGEESIALVGDHTTPKLTLGPGPELLLTSIHWEMFSRTRRVESRFVVPNGAPLPAQPGDDVTDGNDAERTSGDSITSTATTSASPEPSVAIGADPAPTSTGTARTDRAATNGSERTNEVATVSDVQQADAKPPVDEAPQVQSTKRTSGGCHMNITNQTHSASAWLTGIALSLAHFRRRRRAPNLGLYRPKPNTRPSIDGLPTTRVRHRRPRLLRRQRVTRLQQLDADVVRRTDESHVPVTRGAIDRYPATLQTLTCSIYVINSVGEVSEVASTREDFWIPIVGKLDLSCIVTGGG
jgi:hypothetical protein